MNKIMLLATSTQNSDAKALETLLCIKYGFRIAGDYQDALKRLRYLKLIDARHHILSDVYQILDSALECNIYNIEQSIIRSPLKGKYIEKPLTLQSSYYNMNSILNIHWNHEKNKMQIFLANRLPLRTSINKPIRRADEFAIDELPYKD